mmetsp:Transcript_7595/g.28641  ORF Transcript_7595/g.28641 Transcript_7595/m.28641 type:complete len:192 (-) Transcript_7595:955-1530(-)
MEKAREERREAANALLSKYAISSDSLPLLSATEIQQRSSAGETIVLIDVRTEAEQSVSMLPNALAQEAFEADFRASPERFNGAVLVPYCTIGFRSGLYAGKLQRKVRQLEAERPGFQASVANSEGVVMWSYEVGEFWTHDPRSAEPKVVKRLHVYGSEWDVAAEDMETTKFGFWGSAQGLWRVVKNYFTAL